MSRLLYYNDARHWYMYVFEPPISLDDARRPIDEIAGTQVDVFVYGFGAGATMFHDTKVGEVWGTQMVKRGQDFRGVYTWRAYENVQSLIERGYDPLNVLIERAHEKKIEFYSSIRLTTFRNPDNWSWFTNTFALEHPEFQIGQAEGVPENSSVRFNMDFAHPEVRDERFTLIEETLTRYDVDGLELDFCFSPYLFKPNEVKEKTPLMTEFVQKIRKTALKAAEDRSRPIKLGARILPVLEGNLKAGLDVPEWLRLKLLDFAVPIFYDYWQMDPQIPFDWLVDLAHPFGCKVYPALRSNIERVEMTHTINVHDRPFATPSMYYAAALNYWQKGADGIYVLEMKWPFSTEERNVLSTIGDPSLLDRAPKHYFLPPRNDEATAFGYTQQIPAKLIKNQPTSVKLTVSDKISAAKKEGVIREISLHLRFTGISRRDELIVTLNGQKIPLENATWDSYSYLYCWLNIPLFDVLPLQGDNAVGITLSKRPPKLNSDVELKDVELLIKYNAPCA